MSLTAIVPRPPFAWPVRRRRGQTLVWFGTAIGVLVAIGILAVDVGRLQTARGELRAAVDAAARAGMAGLDDGTSVARAQAAASANVIEGRSVVVAASDVTVGTWNATTRTFAAGGAWPNAVRVTAHLGPTRSNAIAGTFAAVLGGRSPDDSATAVASGGEIPSTTFSAKANPWYAGMASTPGSAGAPPARIPINISGGTTVRIITPGDFEDYDGSATFTADGNTANVVRYALGQNGIANVRAPENSVIGVFLSDDPPTAGAMPAELDFSTPGSRNFASISPGLKQAFFIGDGVRADGVTLQSIVAPAGATRLFVGTHESTQHYTNVGSLTTYTVSRSTKLSTVR